MNELDLAWSQMLAQAIENAKVSGRSDVVDYLSLKAANDTLRAAGLKWLLDSAISIAAESNRASAGTSIERTEPHNFEDRGANMVGSRLQVRLGVRCLTIEGGWTRTPADGFMRSGSLAFARITHFGMPKSNAEIVLTRDEDPPGWRVIQDGQVRRPFTGADLQKHFDTLFG